MAALIRPLTRAFFCLLTRQIWPLCRSRKFGGHVPFMEPERRAGKLLETVPPARGANQNISTAADTNVVMTRERIATDAGMSKRQKDTALRVAAVPRESFEQQVESDAPPTITAAVLAQCLRHSGACCRRAWPPSQARAAARDRPRRR